MRLIPIEQVRAGQVVALHRDGVCLDRLDVHAVYQGAGTSRVVLSDATGVSLSAPAGTDLELLDIPQAAAGVPRRVVLSEPQPDPEDVA